MRFIGRLHSTATRGRAALEPQATTAALGEYGATSSAIETTVLTQAQKPGAGGGSMELYARLAFTEVAALLRTLIGNMP